MAELRRGDNAALLKIYQEREVLAEQYGALTAALGGALEKEDADAVKRVLAERDALIQAIDAQQPEIDKRAAEGVGDALLDETAGRIRELFLTARETDEKNMRMLQSLMHRTSEESRKLTQSRKGIGVYGQKNMFVSPGFFDELK